MENKNQNNKNFNQDQILITIFSQLYALVRLRIWDLETKYIAEIDKEIAKETDNNKKEILLKGKASRVENYKKNLMEVAYPKSGNIST